MPDPRRAARAAAAATTSAALLACAAPRPAAAGPVVRAREPASGGRALLGSGTYMWAEVVSGSCSIEHNCVQSPNYPMLYGNWATCEIAVNVDAASPIHVEHWDVQDDKLYVNNAAFDDDTSGPEGVVPTADILWTANAQTAGTGWRLCDVGTGAPTLAPTLPPTSAPTLSPTPTPASTTVITTTGSAATATTVTAVPTAASTATTSTGLVPSSTASGAGLPSTTAVTATGPTATTTTAGTSASLDEGAATATATTASTTETSTTFWMPQSPPAEDFAQVSSSVRFLLALGGASVDPGRVAVGVQRAVAERLAVPEAEVEILDTRLALPDGGAARRLGQARSAATATEVEVEFQLGAADMGEATEYQWRLEWGGGGGAPGFAASLAQALRAAGLGEVLVDDVSFAAAAVVCPCPPGYGRVLPCDEGECLRCEPNEFGGAEGVCAVCADGMRPSGSREECQPCAPDSAGTSGQCGRCHEGSEPNAERTACVNEEWLGLTESEWTALGVVAGVLGLLFTMGGIRCCSKFSKITRAASIVRGRSYSMQRPSMSSLGSRRSLGSKASEEIVSEITCRIDELTEDEQEAVASHLWAKRSRSRAGSSSPASSRRGGAEKGSGAALDTSSPACAGKTPRKAGALPQLLAGSDGQASTGGGPAEQSPWTWRSSRPDWSPTPTEDTPRSTSRGRWQCEKSNGSVVRSRSEPFVRGSDGGSGGPGSGEDAGGNTDIAI